MNDCMDLRRTLSVGTICRNSEVVSGFNSVHVGAWPDGYILL